MGYLGFACQWTVGLIFGWSAVSKLHSRAAFEEFAAVTTRLRDVVSHGRSGRRAGSWGTGTVVVAAEVAVPILLVAPGLRHAGLGVAMVLL